MADFATRTRILRDSTIDPTNPPLSEPRLSQVNNARTLRDRIRGALIDVANDSIPLNKDVNNSNSTPEERNALIWAMRTQKSIEAETADMLDWLLASFDAANESAIFAGNSDPSNQNTGDAALKAEILKRRGSLMYRAGRDT